MNIDPDQKPNAGGQPNRERDEIEEAMIEEEALQQDPPEGCIIVGVGASAGGLEAYKQFLRNLSPNTGMAFVLVQHLDPNHKSLMAELLSKYTEMPVVQIEQATSIEPDHVYMIPPNRFLTVRNQTLVLEEPITKRGVRLPIDHFFQSLAKNQREKAVCVVLSGTGSDGAEGLREIKACGGMTIVQQPETAEHDGMPRSAISTGVVDFVLPVEQISDVIVPYACHPYVQSGRSSSIASTAPDVFRAILSLLRAYTNHDFIRYKTGTVTRRIERRIGIRHIDNPADYLELLRRDQDEVHALFRDMLIGVTRFFREPEAWDELQTVLAQTLADKHPEEPVRVWVPGCSTGEEAYTIAILLFDLQERLKRRFDLQIFATDIDADAIEVGRLGLYPENVTKDLPEDKIDAFFFREGEKLRVKKRLRESCVFAVQNLLSDPPFSNLDLVSCRNLLIYLESDIQQRVFDMFHFALRPEGLLFLGSSESPAKRKSLFETISQRSRLYRKIGTSKPGSGGFPVDRLTARPQSPRANPTPGPPDPSPIGTVELAKRVLLEEFVPASALVDDQGVVQYLHGPVRNYLEFPSGEPTLELGSIAMSGLKAKVRTALVQARDSETPFSVVAPRLRRDEASISVRIRVKPLPRTVRDMPKLYLFSFEDEPVAPSPEPKPQRIPASTKSGDNDEADGTPGDAEQRRQELVLELQATREDLQSTIEELESANEELKASNEEVMSMNEELQSTNEELETSREELQSLNEELSTVNNQLHEKVTELETTNNDLTNLLSSTDMATLFLDSDLRIRRFTPSTVRLMSLIDTDIGRPLSDISPRVNDPHLEDDARDVLDLLSPVEREVSTHGDQWFNRRITPFRTAENKIEGVVVTFADITKLKEAAEQLEAREEQQAVIARLGRAALAGTDLPSLFDRAVQAVMDTLGTDFGKLMQFRSDHGDLLMVAGRGWDENLTAPITVSAGSSSQAGYTLQTAGPVISADLSNEKRFSGPQLLLDHEVTSGISVVVGPGSHPWGVFGTHSRSPREFTIDDANFVASAANILWEAIRRDTVERELRSSERRTAAFLNNSEVIGWMKNEAGEYVYLSDTFRERFVDDDNDWIGKTDDDFWPDEIAASIRTNDRQVLRDNRPIEVIERVFHGDQAAEYLVSKFPFIDANGDRFVGGLGVNITQRLQAERDLQTSQCRLQRLVDSASVGIAFAQPDGTVLQANDALLQMFHLRRDDFEREGWNWCDTLLPLDHEFAGDMRELGKAASEKPVELGRELADGSTIWVLASARPLDDTEEEYVAYLVDITAQKTAELALSESEDRLRLAARMANFGTYYGDLDSGELAWSPEMKRILGYDESDEIPVALGGIPEFVHEDDQDELKRAIEESLKPEGNGIFKSEHRVIRPDGEVHWILMQGRTIFRKRGSTRHAVRIAGITLDITQRRQFEDDLKKARREADAANEAKSQFLANMSHEIRTPMTAILGYAEVLQSRTTEPETQACLTTIRENGQYLCEILNDTLDLSKIEAGKMTVHRNPTDLPQLLSSVRSLLNVRAVEKDLELIVSINNAVPKVIESDSKMIRQILVNLVGNAIKFTDAGQVRLTVEYSKESHQLQFAVSDTGVGIDNHDLKRLFQPFEQADGSMTRQAGGTGLGLVITRRLVHLLGGEVTVESQPGEGSTFRFNIETGPLEQTDWISPKPLTLEEVFSDDEVEPLPTLSGTVLAVDDRPEIRFLVHTFIEQAGATCQTASDGEQAIEAWETARSSGGSFDLILMDSQMPVMDGLTATQLLREKGYTGPILALTANVLETDRLRCLEAGCNDVLKKPIDRVELLKASKIWIGQTVPTDLNTTTRTILFVDDDQMTRQATEILLSQKGYEVRTASNRDEALAAIAEAPPEIVVLDLGLGRESGDELLAELRAKPELAEAFAVCASGRQSDEVDWKTMGFDAFLQKPTDLKLLDELIRQALG